MLPPDRCPACDAFFWVGIPNPDTQIRLGGQTAINRAVILYDAEGERVESFRCPDCTYEWDPHEAQRLSR